MDQKQSDINDFSLLN